MIVRLSKQQRPTGSNVLQRHLIKDIILQRRAHINHSGFEFQSPRGHFDDKNGASWEILGSHSQTSGINEE